MHRKVACNGKEYASIAEACRENNIDPYVVRTRRYKLGNPDRVEVWGHTIGRPAIGAEPPFVFEWR